MRQSVREGGRGGKLMAEKITYETLNFMKIIRYVQTLHELMLHKHLHLVHMYTEEM